MPSLKADHALFLDIDGTLIDIAPTPDAVVVPPGLPGTLARLRAGLGGALAVISGRPMAQIDALLALPGLAAAAEHGAQIRLPDGRTEHSTHRLQHYDVWLAALREAAAAWSGVLIEAKTYSLVAHYRLAPAREAQVRDLVESLAGRDAEILPARMAFEIRPHGFGKGHALRRLMADHPFTGRSPLFIGDDVTDEAAISEAIAQGGTGLHVERDFGGSPQAVRAWLARQAADLPA